MRDPRQVVLRPLVTEKATTLKDDRNQVSFQVAVDANKVEIRRAVERIFNVKVTDVRTQVVFGKEKRMGRFVGRRASWKKAVVQLALQRRGIGERGIADGGAQVCEQLEMLAQTEQASLGALVVGHAVPFGAADGAKHHGIGGESGLHGGVGNRLAVGIVSAAADEVGLGLDLCQTLRVNPVDQALDLAHHLGADAVTGEQE